MPNHEVVSRQAWLDARRALLQREKAFTRQRDELARERQALPWVKLDKAYQFDGSDERCQLGDLFDGRSQLIVYHFMFDPGWNEGCKSCSFWADGFDRTVDHLKQRDVTLVAVSRAPLAKLEDFRRRMGWRFPWFSSGGSDFNYDFGVSFTADQVEADAANYNFGNQRFRGSEAPGLSVFVKDETGKMFHTYSCYARGLDPFNPAYQLLDVVPKGRDESALSYPMAWVRLRDRYGS